MKTNENAKFFPQLDEKIECHFIELSEPYTVVELKMFSLVQAILSKTNWSKKYLFRFIENKLFYLYLAHTA